MKQFTRWLSLFLAGVLLTVTFASCDSAPYYGSDNDDDSERVDRYNSYKNLSPSELYVALTEAKEYTAEAAYSTVYDGEPQSRGMIFEKDDSKLKLTQTIDSEDEKDSRVAYFDLTKSLAYVESEDGWTVSYEDTELEELLEALTQLNNEVLFSDDSYGEYDSQNSRYDMKSDAALEAIWSSDEEAECSLYLTCQGTTYTFTLNARQDGQTIEYALVIKFKDVSVSLPEVERNGVVGDYSPSELYRALLSSENASVALSYVETSANSTEYITYSATRDQNAVLLEESERWITDGEEDSDSSENYYDLDTNLYYYEEDGEWLVEEDPSDTTWANLMDTLLSNDGDYWVDILLSDDNYEAEANGNRCELKADVLTELVGEEATGAKGYMEYKDNVYTVWVSADYEDESLVTRLVIDFSPGAVKLPVVTD